MSKQQKRQKHKNNNKNSNKQTQANGTHTPTTSDNVRQLISSQKRNELSNKIKSLYALTTKPCNNVKDEWEQYVAIQRLLQEIMLLEEVLSTRKAMLAEKAAANGTTLDGLRLENIQSFNKWLSENEVKHEGLCVTEFPGFGLGIQTTKEIKEGDILFSIPRKMMLNEEWLEKDNENAKSLNGITLSNVKLAYTLILETLKGTESFWKPYIDLLPVEYSTALYFSIDDMEELRGSNLLSLALRHCKVIARQYAAFYHCAQNVPPSENISKTGLLVKEMFCYDLYRWAVSTAMTRQNMIPKQDGKGSTDEQKFISTLIPFWDMVNHKQGKITTFYQPEENAITSSAQSDFKEGEQIFMHYGNRPNSELMIHNGFINEGNTNDYVNIKMGLSTSDSLHTQRCNVLELLEIPSNGELSVLPAPDFISGKLLAFVRVFNMNEAQLEHWNSPDHAKDLLHVDCALETELELKTWKYLQTRLMLLLRAFPTTLEADEEKLAAYRKDVVQLSYAKAMILEYRISEKRILADALEYAKQRTKA